MKRNQLIFLALMMVCSPAFTNAQNWTGIIAPSRAVNWSNAGVRGGIVNRTTNCVTSACNTLAGGTVTAASINAAIASAPANTVVNIPAGTYTIGSPGILLTVSNITLRGAGAASTILNFTASNGCGGEQGDICMSSPNLYWQGSADIQPGGSHAHNWTGGYTKVATSITVDSNTGLSVGTIIALDQANDSADTGHWSTCDLTSASPPCSLEGGSLGRVISGLTHAQLQFVQITGINGTTLTISPGLYASNWSSGKSPGIFWTGALTGTGIENLTINNNTSDGYAGITIQDADSCWVSGIKSTYTLNSGSNGRNHIWIFLSSHITVQNSYFYGTRAAASLSYGTETTLSGDNLIVNNIYQHIANPRMIGESDGDVYAYNFGTDDYIGDYYVMAAMVNEHDAGNYFLLEEGNDGPGDYADLFHGNADAITYFRNHFTGYDTSGGYTKNEATTPFKLNSFNRYYNIVGNVLGTSGVTTTYEAYAASSGLAPNGVSDSGVVYSLGDGNTESPVTIPTDVTVRNTLLRWGNYDVVNNTSRFVSSEVPSGLTDGYANPVPANNNLPNSFFLSGKPSWWPSSTPWPPIGPDVTGGDLANLGGHAYTIPSRNCYLNVMGGKMDGTSGVLTFNPTTCYSQTTASGPAAPTSLTATVQVQ